MIKNTISSTALRHHLDEVFDQVANGKEITVTHRFKQSLVIRSKESSKGLGASQPLAGLKEFEKTPKKPSEFDSTTPIKQLRKEYLDKKYAR
jgi:antitoxin (DNA-binding transcriptional repressor) of toxin-antitoxin stability system